MNMLSYEQHFESDIDLHFIFTTPLPETKKSKKQSFTDMFIVSGSDIHTPGTPAPSIDNSPESSIQPTSSLFSVSSSSCSKTGIIERRKRLRMEPILLMIMAETSTGGRWVSTLNRRKLY